MIYKFDKNSSPRDWRIIDDGVMGGLSEGNFKINADGHGQFYGQVTLENNGGFSSIRHICDKLSTASYNSIKIRIKGDGKSYQLRIKSNARDYYSYITTFKTSGEWEEIKLPLKNFYPSFRGRTLNFPNFDQENIEEISFLIANNKEEKFVLLLDYVALE
jgi:hypothetical protein